MGRVFQQAAKRRKLKIESADYGLDGIYVPDGSDQKVPGGVKGICALCDRTETLKLSHIAPKWMYKWAKAEGTLVGDYKTLGIRTREQDGRKHYLLCNECEQYLGEAEGYVCILQDQTREEDRKSLGIVEGDHDQIIGLNYDLIERFIVGVAFKASLVDSAPYHALVFSKTFVADCKRVLRGEKPVQHFSFFAIRFYCNVSKDIDPRAMVFVHRNYYRSMGEAFVILGAGWEWDVIRHKSNVMKIPIPVPDLVIKRNEPAYVPWGEIMDHRFFMKDETEHAGDGKPDPVSS